MPAATIVPTSAITDDIAAERHIRPLICDELNIRPVLITKKGLFMSPTARLVIDTIIRTYQLESART